MVLTIIPGIFVILYCNTCAGAIVTNSSVSGPVFLDNLVCSGREDSLLDCINYLHPLGVTDCPLHNMAVVQCPGTLMW